MRHHCYSFLSLMHDFMELYPSEGFLGVLLLQPWNQRFPKSSISSERHRIFANMCFQKREFKYALEYYNGSLCYAPPGSIEIPLAYGNRSALYCELGQYDLALENIKLARENGFPADKMAKLDEREEKCLKAIKKSGPDNKFDVSSFFKLSHPPNEKIPFIAGCMELRKSPQLGRQIITNKDLKTGDIIAIEDPAFTWLNPLISGPACIFCTKTNHGSLIPCSHCVSVMFCSEECRAKAALIHPNDAFYKTYAGEKYGKTLKMQLEAYRIAGGVEELIELLKDTEDKTIFDFDFSNPDDPAKEKNMLIALNGLDKNSECVAIMSVDPNQLLNIAPINEKPRSAEDRQKLLKFILDQCQILCGSLSLFNRNHQGIYLFLSLIKHSCESNVLPFKYGQKSVLIITRPVKAGEPLFLSCTKLLSIQATTERFHMLLSREEKCDCEECDIIPTDFPNIYPRKDRRFIEPRYEEIEPAEAMAQFKKNCEYIDKKSGKKASYEIERLVDHNVFLMQFIAGTEVHHLLNDYEIKDN